MNLSLLLSLPFLSLSLSSFLLDSRCFPSLLLLFVSSPSISSRLLLFDSLEALDFFSPLPSSSSPPFHLSFTPSSAFSLRRFEELYSSI
ncbi:hypothetical protein V6Z12_D11G014600 [Gossypium hirsutum]